MYIKAWNLITVEIFTCSDLIMPYTMCSLTLGQMSKSQIDDLAHHPIVALKLINERMSMETHRCLEPTTNKM
jgi:hypothetical protein